MFMILFKVPDHIENGEKEDAETRNTRMLDIKKILWGQSNKDQLNMKEKNIL